MSISKFPQSQSALTTAFETIANHVGAATGALEKLADLEGKVVAATQRYINSSVSVACPAATALAAFLSGALKTAEGNATPVGGNVFVLSTAQDTSDTAFDTAKGSAPAIGDVFVVNSAGTGVDYIGTTAAALDTALLPYTYRGYNSDED